MKPGRRMRERSRRYSPRPLAAFGLGVLVTLGITSAGTIPIVRAAGLVGDLNGDGSVGIIDLSLLLTNWGKTSTTPTSSPAATPVASPVADTVPADAVRASAYGTAANGTKDDTAALVAAMAAANGKSLYIEPGTYLTSGLNVSGPAVIYAKGVTLKAAGGATPLLEITRPVTIKGIGLDGNGKQQPGIRIGKITGVTISACTIKNINSDPGSILIDGATGVSIDGCSISGSVVDGIHVVGAKNVVVMNTTITGSGRHGIQWWGGDSANPIGPSGTSDLTFKNNTVKNVGNGGIWGSMGEHITVTGNVVENCGDVCIDPEGGNDATVSGNKVHNGKNGGITTFYAAKNVTISDNTIVQDAGYGHGIMIYGTGTSRLIRILNNVITTNGSNGVYTYDNTLSDSTVTGNTFNLLGGGIGVDIHMGSGNTVSNNTIK